MAQLKVELEPQLIEVWREVLDRDTVGAHDSFFHLGGTSLKLLTLHARIKAATGQHLPMVDLFEHPTPASLAAHLLELECPTNATDADPASPQGDTAGR